MRGWAEGCRLESRRERVYASGHSARIVTDVSRCNTVSQTPVSDPTSASVWVNISV